MKKYQIIAFFTLLFFTTSFIKAQSRPPTPQEKKAILKEINAVSPIIISFANDDWESDYEPTDPQYFSVQPNSDVVMATSSYVGAHYAVRNGSARYNKIAKPYLDKIASNPPDANNQKQMEEYMKEGDSVHELLNVYIEVTVNEKNIPVKPGTNDLKIHGVYFAYKEDNSGDKTLHLVDHGKSAYVLAFGNWNTAKLKDNNYQFHFAHALGTPYIENIVILIYGAPDRVREILHNTDWKKVNDGLTL